MNFVNKVVIFLIFLGLGILIANLLPSRISKDQNQASVNNDAEQMQDESRVKFRAETLPTYYPQLVDFLKETTSETISWRDESGEDKNIRLSFSQLQGMVVETELYIGASQNGNPMAAQPLHVRMVDTDTDGVMDSIEMTKSNGDSAVFHQPFDEVQHYMWEVSLAIAFRLSKCCSK